MVRSRPPGRVGAVFLGIVVAGGVATPFVAADDIWPGLWGPNGNGRAAADARLPRGHTLRVREAWRWTATPGWRTPDLRAGISPSVAHAGDLYGFGGDSLVCIDAGSGKTEWKERLYPGSLIVVDGHLVVLSATAGLLRVVEATALGYREKGRLEVLNRGAQAWAPPAYTDRRVFVRNEEEIAAIGVK